MLEVNHIVPEVEVGEIHLEGIADRLRMMGLQAPRPRHFVAPINLRIRDHNPSGHFAQKPSGNGTREDFRNRRRRSTFSAFGSTGGQEFAPQFSEALKLAGIVAEDLKMVALPQPPLHLLEKGPSLLLGNLSRGQGCSDGTERIEGFNEQIIRIAHRFRNRILDPDPDASGGLNPQLQGLPGLMEHIPLSDLTSVVFCLESQRLRPAKNHQCILAPVRIESAHRG